MPMQMVIACTSPMSRQANAATTAMLSLISLFAIITYHRVDAAACSAITLTKYPTLVERRGKNQQICFHGNNFLSLLVTNNEHYDGEYCPNGWSVQRKANDDPTTCDPMQSIKCDKPYQCVHSSCGISFCCAHQNSLNEWKKQEDMKREMEEEERYEL